jgi:hypothetical protein
LATIPLARTQEVCPERLIIRHRLGEAAQRRRQNLAFLRVLSHSLHGLLQPPSDVSRRSIPMHSYVQRGFAVTLLVTKPTKG